MSRGTPVGQISGVECQECGSIRTRTRSTGYSHDDDRIRRRVCMDCGTPMLTVELPLPTGFTWGGLAPYARAKDRERAALTFGHRAHPDWLRPEQRIQAQINMVYVRAKGRRGSGEVCYKGHPWTPDSTFHRKDTGARNCRICRRDSERGRADRKREAAGIES